MQRLLDRVAVVTGAGSGIGLASGRRLAAEGAKIVSVDIDGETGKAAAAEAGGIFVQADVTSEDDVRAVYETAAREFGRVDIAFNNAGISPPEDDSILVTGLDAWRRVQEVNLTSVYLCCKHVIPHMQRAGKGSIINTASFVAVLGAATSQISYTASKGGVLAMSRELGVQFARAGIRVNALCPGPVNTPLLQELFAKDPELAARRLVHIPAGRFAEPEEIAAAVAFLASDDASFITASSFLVDGGISEVIGRLDGLVLSGGGDIDPAGYGAEPHPQTTSVRPHRDAAEAELLSAALRRGLPVLGICRGLQVINVAMGGSLHQHLPDVVGHHGHASAPGSYGAHPVRVKDGSQLAGILGRTQVDEVPTQHHQAVQRLGDDLSLFHALVAAARSWASAAAFTP